MKKIRKAIVATVGTLGAGMGVALLDGHLDGAETLATLGGALVVGFAAWRVPNARPKRRRPRYNGANLTPQR